MKKLQLISFEVFEVFLFQFYGVREGISHLHSGGLVT